MANGKVFADKQMDGRANFMPPIYRCRGIKMVKFSERAEKAEGKGQTVPNEHFLLSQSFLKNCPADTEKQKTLWGKGRKCW